jgi:hypothetical protein
VHWGHAPPTTKTISPHDRYIVATAVTSVVFRLDRRPALIAFDANDPITGHERAALAAMHGFDLLYSAWSLGLQRRELIGLLGDDAASPFALATRKDGLGEEPCARSVLFCSVSQ